MMAFDPYHKWLAILPKDQPPHHYRLLGLELFESDLDVIEGSADRAMGYIRQYQSGEHAALAAKLLNEIASARLCLLKPKSKSDYDAKLKQDLAVPEPADEPGINFEIDAELSELMRAPKPSVRSKRKKKQSPVNIWLAGGIAALLILVIAVFLSGSGKPRRQVESRGASVAETKPSAVDGVTKGSPTDSNAGNIPETVATSSTAANNASAPVVEPVGSIVNLLEAVDPLRDTFEGQWTKKGQSLIGEPAGRIYLPGSVPDDYQLKFTLKRLSGNDAFWIGFLMDGRQGLAVFDGWTARFSGLYVDGLEPHANSTARPGALFQNEKLSTITLTVHPGHLHALVDGRIIIDWRGDANRLNCNTILGLPNRESPFLATSVNPYQIDSAELIPIRPETTPARIARLNNPIELIPLIDPERDASYGKWTLANGALDSPEAFGRSGLFALPVAIPEEYTLSATVELAPDARGRRVFVIGLIAGNSYCSIPIVDVDHCLGLETIDGLRWDKNETRVSGAFLEPGKPVRLDCTVTRRRIRMELGGRTLIHWSGDFRRLGIDRDWAPKDPTKLYFGAETHFRLTDIKIGPPLEPPSLPLHPPIAIGNPVNLLSLIDTKHDTLSGTWTNDGGALRIMGDAPISKLIIPCKVPSEYRLTMAVAREPGGATNESLVLNLPVDSFMAEVFLDAFSSTVNGIDIDRLTVDHSLNNSSKRLQAILPNQTQEVVVTVRKTGLKVVNGSRTIIDWTGNPNRFWMQPEWSTPGDRIAIASNHSRFRFERLQIEPVEPSSFPPVSKLGSDGNLLAIIDPRRDSRKGQWTGGATGIVSPAGFPGTRLTIPVTPPEKYVLTADVERKKGVTQFCLGLVVGGHSCNVVIDGGGEGNEAGLERLDDKPFGDAVNTTHRKYPASLLAKGKRVPVRYYVMPDTVVVTCGDKEVIRWHGDPRRLSLEHFYLPPNDSETDRAQLWLGAWDAEFLIRKLTLKPLDEDVAMQIESSFTGVFPTTSQHNVPLAEAEVSSNAQP